MQYCNLQAVSSVPMFSLGCIFQGHGLLLYTDISILSVNILEEKSFVTGDFGKSYSFSNLRK